MKQGKKLLCILLAMIMALSCLTIGVSAASNPYWKDYNYPAGYDKVNKPYFSPEQGASALLDMVDNLLAEEVNVNESILGVDIVITSLNTTLDTVNTILDNWFVKAIKAIASLGDLESLKISIASNGNYRRGKESEITFMLHVFQFLADNADPLYKFIGNKFEVGFIDRWFDPAEELPELTDIHGLVNELVYGLLIEDIDFEDAANAAKKAQVDAMTLDGILQDFIDNRCFTFICDMFAEVEDGVPSNVVAEFLGLEMNPDGTLKDQIGFISDLFPSLKSNPDSLSITKTSLYDWIHNLFHALIDDVAVPYGGRLILEALDISPDDTAAEAEELSYIDVAIGLFVTDDDFPNGYPEGTTDTVSAFLQIQGCPNPTNPRALDKINAALKYILGSGVKLHGPEVYEGIQKFIRFKDDGNGGRYLMLDETLMGDLSSYIKLIIPMLSSLIPDTFAALTPAEQTRLDSLKPEEAATDAEKKAVNEKIFAFLVEYLLSNLVKEVKFNYDVECNTVRELATWTLVNVAAELLPDIDFEAKIASGDIDPNSDDCLDIAAAVVAYYLNGELGMEIAYEGITFEGVLSEAFDFFLTKYAVLFTTTSYSGPADQKIWHDFYETANQWIPLTNIVYGVTNDAAGARQIIMDKIIDSVLDFDLSRLFSIIGVRSNSNAEFKKPLSRIVANLLARVLNGVFHLPTEQTAGVDQKTLIIPYSYTTLDQILVLNPAGKSGNLQVGLQNTAYRLISSLPKLAEGTTSLAGTSADLLAELLGVIDLDYFEYMPNKFRTEGTGGQTYSINDLRTLYSRLSLESNEGKKYYENGYQFFHMVDFTPWVYLEFKSALADARSLLEQQEKAKAGSAVAPDRQEITYAYYALSQYDIMIRGNQRAASAYQLRKTIAKYATPAPDSKYANIPELIQLVESGKDAKQQKQYTERTYNAFKNAWLFAKSVETEFKNYERLGRQNEYRQSKINTARSELIDAVLRLKPWVENASYDYLDAAMQSVLNATTSPSACTKETVDKVVEAFKQAKKVDRDYDIDEQVIIDNLTEKLNDALSNLKTNTCLTVDDPTTTYVNFDKKFVYGLGLGFYDKNTQDEWESYGLENPFEAYFNTYYGYASAGDDAADNVPMMEILPTLNGNGTGARIVISIQNEEGVKKALTGYDVVIFGDMNGDSQCDGMDSMIMKMYTGLMLDKDLTAESVYAGGDANNDGTIGTTDSNIAANYGLGVKTVEIDQCPDSVRAQALTFADLVA